MNTLKITSTVTTLSYNSRLDLEMEDPRRGMTELDDDSTQRARAWCRVPRRNLLGVGEAGVVPTLVYAQRVL